jgi:hypothetical protein
MNSDILEINAGEYMPADTKELDAFASAPNHSAQRLQTLWFSFLAVSAYLAISAFTTRGRGACALACAGTRSFRPAKVTGDGVTLSASMFDHAKLALIDETICAGVPPVNPFFTEVGVPGGVAYYYRWHFATDDGLKRLGSRRGVDGASPPSPRSS